MGVVDSCGSLIDDGLEEEYRGGGPGTAQLPGVNIRRFPRHMSASFCIGSGGCATSQVECGGRDRLGVGGVSLISFKRRKHMAKRAEELQNNGTSNPIARKAKFPGRKIYTEENAPPVVIRTWMMDYLCGGVHERLGQLPWDLYLANQTNRILFIWWENPLLEGYLIPIALLDWSIPPAVKKTTAQNV